MSSASSYPGSGKVVLITGASSGIGAGSAKHLASLGYSLALNARSEPNLRQVAQQCRQQGLAHDQVLLVPGDVTQEADVKRIIAAVMDTFHQLDVLVNNAGILVEGDLQNSSMQDFDRVINTNVRAPVQMAKLCLPHLIKAKGNIINISSICSLRSYHTVMFYGMGNSALDMFTRTLAAEVAPKGVRVNSINPGVIDTGIHLRAGVPQKQYEEYMERMAVAHPVGRVGRAEDVARALAFLISENASFIVGSILVVDGGRIVLQNR